MTDPDQPDQEVPTAPVEHVPERIPDEVYAESYRSERPDVVFKRDDD